MQFPLQFDKFNFYTFYKINIAKSLILSDEDNFCYISDVIPKISGWYMLEAIASSERQMICASMVFDRGSGFSRGSACHFLLKNKKAQKRIIYISSKSKRLKLLFSEDQGKCDIQSLKFVKVTQAFALNRMKRKLGLSSPQSSKDKVSHIWRSYCQYFKNNYNLAYLANLGPSYKSWILTVEKPSLPSDATIKQSMDNWGISPLISIVLPTYNTPAKYLVECIESVQNQTYPNWELCIADDASTQAHVRETIEKYCCDDSRIKACYRRKNGHISKTTNSALDLAEGDYIAFLDHDDTLSEHALYFIVQEINLKPDVKIIYSDEDWTDENGKRLTPHFKSDWNQDLFFSHNYITHLAVYCSDLLKTVKGLRVGVEGSQDYDLILRCLPYIKPAQITHIPRVLYHWRAIEGSTALAAGEKSYTVEAGRKSLASFFNQTGQPSVSVEASEIDNTYRIHWPLPGILPSVTLIIPTKDMKVVLEKAVTSILEKTEYVNYHIVIVDNGSVEVETLKYFEHLLEKEERVSVLVYNKEFNYSAINNFAVANTKSDIVGLINNDVEVINSGWLTELVSHASRLDIGCVGAKLYYPDNTLQHGGIIMGLGGGAGHSHRHFPREHPGYIGRLKMVQNLSGVTGACLLVRRSIYDEVDGLDELNLKVAYNDVDFCLKVREAGYRNLWTPFAELYHFESLSRGYEDSPEKLRRFKRETEFLRDKWGAKLIYDPFYNQNLTKIREDFSIGI